MSKRIKDTDYLFLSTRIHVLEQTLLTKERMNRMIDASTNEDAVRVLEECGYPEFGTVDVDSVNSALVVMRDKVFNDLYKYAPNTAMIDVFKLKYDYHNVKVILKAEAMGVDYKRLLVSIGRYSTDELIDCIREDNYRNLSADFANAIKSAKEILHTTKDPQLSDNSLDCAYFNEMLEISKSTGSKFLTGYVRLLIDAANIKTVVRVLRMKKNGYLKTVLFNGGNISVDKILRMTENDQKFDSVYGNTLFAQAAEVGQSVINGGSLTKFERLIDNAVISYLSGAKYIAFGEAVVIGYLVARENELTAVRIIMTGRLAGLDSNLIRERLRDAYV